MNQPYRLSAVPVALLAVVLLLVGAPAAQAVPPTADSGPDLVAEAGDTVTLSGSASDSDGDPLQISWLLSVVADGDLTSCTFTGPTSPEPLTPAGLAPDFSCTEPGQYLLQLVAADATDFFDDTGALVTFTEPSNTEPDVDSGPDRTAPAGSTVGLEGSASDPDGDPLEIHWLLSVVSDGDLATCTFSGPTSFEPLTAAGLEPDFSCTEPGEYLVQLVAGDGTTSVDDLGALVTFTDPLDLTAPTCRAVSPVAGVTALTVRDPQSEVARVRVQRTWNAAAWPRLVRADPPRERVRVGVRTRVAHRPSAALVVAVNGDGARRVCLVVDPPAGDAFVLQHP